MVTTWGFVCASVCAGARGASIRGSGSNNEVKAPFRGGSLLFQFNQREKTLQ